MKKAIFIGLGIVGVILLFALIIQDADVIFALSGLAAAVSFLLAALSSRAIEGGEKNWTEEEMERKGRRTRRRKGKALMFTMIGLPNFLTAVLSYLFL
ncbi:DUF5316 family protein [Salipaludibacillus aurantiacus]|uniref:DUF5316 domain-containing protein n=1 Tax=Salipaludibacillus aurantiacus TaxID=1601833 RepID=A0A1H9S5V0_9BACI|nr:DUF5316 family protein [Salipaludibacillus aurantiacus]SER80436.1 hypothetical protein SAMN05518684_10445 [Salipaludibacillus aurantiacus]